MATVVELAKPPGASGSSTVGTRRFNPTTLAREATRTCTKGPALSEVGAWEAPRSDGLNGDMEVLEYMACMPAQPELLNSRQQSKTVVM
jgi:hypothetical protein